MEKGKKMEMSFQKMQQRETRNSSTVSNMMFLLLSFPLGLIYFIVTVVLLSLGVSTVIIFVGLPILLVALLMIRGMAFVELRLASRLLHLPLPSRPPQNPEGQQRFIS